MDSKAKKGGEKVFNQGEMGSVTDVNQGHNPASAPIVEFGGTNPKDKK